MKVIVKITSEGKTLYSATAGAKASLTFCIENFMELMREKGYKAIAESDEALHEFQISIMVLEKQ
jgi:hypothetical protein